MRRPTLAGLVLIAILGAGACGGTGSGGSPAATTAASASPAAGAPCARATDPVESPVEVSIAGRAYDPDPVEAKVGQPIAWTNEDGVPHTATLDEFPACATSTLSQGSTGALVFSAAGTYAYHCAIHSSMKATITIAP
ncbi:MAG TPA: cupredoxin domain-containing protein [Candidatus Limnocylindrales bacterium]